MRSRGLGRVFQHVYRDRKTRERKKTDTWWIQYSVRGVVRRESARSTKRADAVRLLKKRLAEAGQGRVNGPDVEKTTYADLEKILLTDYRINDRKSTSRVERSCKHLGRFFGPMHALDITEDRIAAYVAVRQESKAKNATINRELAALKRAFHLGERARKVGRIPHVPMLQENNTRKGFFELDQFRAVLSHVSPELRPVLEVAYITGWRIKSEILSRQWQHVDLKGGWLRLEPGETKNGEGRTFRLTERLRSVLERQKERTEALQRERGVIIPWVFHRSGKLIRDFREAWRRACAKAGVPGRIPHDFRRTAVRNLERAGVPRSTAMAMVGHKTESIYRRYAIVDAKALEDGAAKLDAFHEAQTGGAATSNG